MNNNKVIIAAAGSGKTTHIINEALKIKDGRVLLTTYTEANEAEIRKKIIAENKCIPENITVQTWFSFLLQHGARPYQGSLFHKDINGLVLMNQQSARYAKESDTENHYFTDTQKIYSDKLSKFVIKCNENSSSAVIDRLSRIYTHIFIDEVQDLAGYDLELLKLFFTSPSRIVLVGDPRQGTYSTNNSAKNKQYKKSQIVYFFDNNEIQKDLEIDSDSLTTNYRSNQKICDFSNKIFPDHVATSSGQSEITNHDGVFLVRENDVDAYVDEYSSCVQLRDSVKEDRVSKKIGAINFGNSKGLSFDRVLIYPTKPIMDWIKDNNSELKPTSRCKFYVAVTRARYSVGIVYDYTDDEEIKDVDKFRIAPATHQ
jgi:DNA helicase-2/ATP-dependent DNA helicase PcrA